MKLRNKKTGEIREFNEIFLTKIVKETNTATSEYIERSYSTIAKLNEEWEDYKPAEPLIKDEKIRKAVRAWADGNNIESVHYDAFWKGFRRGNSSITVWEELPLEDNKVYTIAELCGEEEE
jgi:hypothetical protein